MIPDKFTYPFCYTPHPLIEDAASRLIKRISADPFLDGLFAEGKMMGVLMVEGSDGSPEYLFAFSGVAGERSIVDGFVPPVFDLIDPSNGFKAREAEISAINARLALPGLDDAEADALRFQRRSMSEELQRWIFKQYMVLNAKGVRRSIWDIFADRGLVPPGGTGDCAAPKLLQYAYLHGLKPIAMGEFWYGASPEKEVRTQGKFYPSCTGKCGPLLTYMMQGLDVEPNPLEEEGLWDLNEPRIVYRDYSLVIADKPSGMLCVPGRTGRTSLQDWLSGALGVPVIACHRLDMDTSGLVVFAFDKETLASMHGLFAGRLVKKRYSAHLLAASAHIHRHGFIKLPLMPDYYDRPRQMVDFELGKNAVTEYELVREYPDGEVDVRLTPHTGRTHQLRVHCAHASGLGRPVKGDRLYGGGSGALHLRADYLSFTHPITGETVEVSL